MMENRLYNIYTKLILLAAFCPMKAVSTDFVKSRASIEALNSMKSLFTEGFFPGLSEIVTNEFPAQHMQSVIFDNSLGKFTGFIDLAGIDLTTSINPDQVNIVAYQKGGETVIEASIYDLRATFRDLVLSVQYDSPVTIPIGFDDLQFFSPESLDCDISLDMGKSSISIGEINLYFNINLDNGQVTIRPDEVELEEADIDLDAGINLSTCNLPVIEFPVILEFFANVVADFVTPYVAKEAGKELSNFLSTFSVNEPQVVPVTKSGMLEVVPDVTSFHVDPSSNFFDLACGCSFFASLSGPQWRQGDSLEPSSKITKDVPIPVIERLFSINLGLDGLNDLIKAGWYLGWSTFVPNEESVSSLCEAAETDPCPFPPIVEDVGMESWLYRLFFIFDGFFSDFFYEIKVDPPVISVDQNDVLTVGGDVKAILVGDTFLFGRKELVSVTGKVAIDSSFPVYDSTESKLSRFTIYSLDVPEVGIDFLGIKRFVAWMFKWSLDIAAHKVINYAIDKYVPLSDINGQIEKTLSGFPLGIPTIPFDDVGLNISVSLMDVAITGKKSSDITMDYLELAGNLAVDVTNTRRQLTTSSTDHPVPSRATNVYDTKAYKNARMPSGGSRKDDHVYVATFKNKETRKREIAVLRPSQSVSGGVEILTDKRKWVSLPSSD